MVDSHLHSSVRAYGSFKSSPYHLLTFISFSKSWCISHYYKKVMFHRIFGAVNILVVFTGQKKCYPPFQACLKCLRLSRYISINLFFLSAVSNITTPRTSTSHDIKKLKKHQHPDYTYPCLMIYTRTFTFSNISTTNLYTSYCRHGQRAWNNDRFAVCIHVRVLCMSCLWIWTATGIKEWF